VLCGAAGGGSQQGGYECDGGAPDSAAAGDGVHLTGGEGLDRQRGRGEWVHQGFPGGSLWLGEQVGCCVLGGGGVQWYKQCDGGTPAAQGQLHKW
jgi:hypothetical protein